MGNKPSQQQRVHVQPAVPEYMRAKIFLEFHIDRNVKNPTVKRSDAERVWVDIFTIGLSTKLLNYLFQKSDEILASDLILMYTQLTASTLDDQRNTLLAILQAYNRTAEFLDKQLMLELCIDMIGSYMKMLDYYLSHHLPMWREAGLKEETTSFRSFAEFVCCDLSTSEFLDETSMGSLLSSNPFLHKLMLDVLMGGYKYHTRGFSGVFPLVVSPKAPLDQVNTLLSGTDIMFLNTTLRDTWNVKWRFLYSMRVNGGSWTTMVCAILNQGPTLIIIEDTKGHVFGAFASCSWHISPQFYGDEECAMFSLRPHYSYYVPSGYNSNFQYLNMNQSTLPNGLGIGGKEDYWGLFLSADFGKGIVSPSCSTFKKYKVPICSCREFEIKNVEIWSCGEPDPTEEELGNRPSAASKSILNVDPGARAILELSGVTQHSANLPETENVPE